MVKRKYDVALRIFSEFRLEIENILLLFSDFLPNFNVTQIKDTFGIDPT